MLTINMEIRKGILFIRLKGTLNKNTVKYLKEEVTNLLKDNGIRNILFNLEQLNSIDKYGIKELDNDLKICKNNRGISLLCGINQNIIKKINCLKEYEIKNELEALQLI